MIHFLKKIKNKYVTLINDLNYFFFNLKIYWGVLRYDRDFDYYFILGLLRIKLAKTRDVMEANAPQLSDAIVSIDDTIYQLDKALIADEESKSPEEFQKQLDKFCELFRRNLTKWSF